jgi:hypothetical protein
VTDKHGQAHRAWREWTTPKWHKVKPSSNGRRPHTEEVDESLAEENEDLLRAQRGFLINQDRRNDAARREARERSGSSKRTSADEGAD